MKYVVDTNVVLDNPEVLESYEVVIPSTVLREIENLELKKSNQNLQYKVRHAKHILFSKLKDGEYDVFDLSENESVLKGFSDDYADNRIVKYASDSGYGILTNDILMILKAKEQNVECISPMFKKRDVSEYEGVTNLYLNDEDNDNIISETVLDFLTTREDNYVASVKMILPLLSVNEYLLFWDKNVKQGKTGFKNVGIYKFTGDDFINVYKNDLVIKSMYEKITPRNVRQKCAIDLLQDDNIKVKALFGTFGAGKDYLMLGQALAVVNDPKNPIDKIVWVRNNIEVKDTNQVGFLPDGLEDKLLPFLMPIVDHTGGDIEELSKLISNNMIEVQHLGFIRGRDIKNSIIYVTETQSNTMEHIQLLLGRVSDGSQIWFNGDDKQTDGAKFEYNNGVRALKKLAGNKLYGQVTLDKVERSDVANLASLFDE